MSADNVIDSAAKRLQVLHDTGDICGRALAAEQQVPAIAGKRTRDTKADPASTAGH